MTINKNWLQAIDQIITASIADQKRIIGITSPNGDSGVTMLSTILAESFALSQFKTLLIDLSGNEQAEHDDDWVPVLQDPARFITKDKAGFDRLESHPDMKNRFIFNNMEKFREILNNTLAEYEVLIIDLPAISSDNHDGINPASCAAACDAVFLIAMSSQTSRSDLAQTQERLIAAKAPLSGIILNDRDHLPTGDSMAKSLQKIRFIPGAKRLAKLIKNSDFLN